MAICMLDALKAERAQALLHSALGGVEEPAAGARGAQRRGRDKMED